MSYAKRLRGLRNITVQGMEFHWRFSPKADNSDLAVYGSISGCQPLLITLLGWQDSWLVFPAASGNEPTTIGPKFVSQAIIFGLANGWLPNQAGAAKCIDYGNSSFSVGQNKAV